jgi:NitT/TauT family transport system ATP-binding protein
VFARAKAWVGAGSPARAAGGAGEPREEVSGTRTIAEAARGLPAAGAHGGRDFARSLGAELEDVSVRFGGAAPVLEGVSLAVRAGEAICLVGPSGGGKSTILNLVAGLVKPTTGRVLAGGEIVTGPAPDRAVVFQDAALFPWLTLEANVSFPLELAGVPREERDERVEAVLRLVQLWKFRASRPHELSGGMRQRGAIARALASRPGMLLFDEPFAALDGQMRELLQGEVERIVRSARTTTLFVTHQIEEAVRIGDRVVLVGVRPGRVIGEVPIDLPRPRRAGDLKVARLVHEIGAQIRAEVEKVARDEADGAWGATGLADRGLDPRRLMGGGI